MGSFSTGKDLIKSAIVCLKTEHAQTISFQLSHNVLFSIKSFRPACLLLLKLEQQFSVGGGGIPVFHWRRVIFFSFTELQYLELLCFSLFI